MRRSGKAATSDQPRLSPAFGSAPGASPVLERATRNGRRRLGRVATVAAAAVLLPFARPVAALDVSSLTNTDAAAGVRQALNRGADVAVSKLGAADGFLGNPKVRIPLPDALKQAERAAKFLGKGDAFEELEVSMNRAAESAVAQARPILVQTIRGMTVTDAKGILTGGDESVTEFFRTRADGQLVQQFLPIVTKTTSQLGLARQYNSLAGQAKTMGLVKGDAASVETYVTRKAVDGLYAMIGEEEKAIRQDPVGTGSSILKRVFGN